MLCDAIRQGTAAYTALARSRDHYERRLGGSLIYSLVHVRVPRSIDGCYRLLSRRRDVHGQFWTVILNPEKRKVGSSTCPDHRL